MMNSREKARRKRKGQLEIKRMFDISVSVVLLLAGFPIWVLAAAAIKLTSKGPVFFIQERPGYHKKIIRVYKFRTMYTGSEKMVKGQEVTLDDSRITPVGHFLRRSKIDEIPQLLNVLLGEMSLVGPRPERMESLKDYDEEISRRLHMLPGMTGLAQVSGNIYLSLSDRYKLDVYYVRHFSLWLDARILCRTIGVVLLGEETFKEKPLVKEESEDTGIDEYGHRKTFHIDLECKKRVLITGADSYIGESFERWAMEHYGKRFHIDTVDMRDDRWRRKDFREYDCVFHVAGIAHADVRKADASVKAQYYAVNTKLAVETARKAKKEKVGQFIFMSSIIIYGDAAKCGRKGCIDEHTVPRPANFYGDSKWQADKKIRSLGDEEFHVAVLRPPMIYGRGSKGNYPVLAKLAKKFPIFPDVDNRRSMLHIDNLCEFLCKLILSGEGGIYFPQNAEYTRTSFMAKEIASVSGKKMVLVKFLRPAVFLASCIPGRISAVVKKAFGNMVYNQNLSVYEGLEYRVNTLKESIQLTEGERGTEKPHILVVSQYFYPESFRINDMVVEWIKRGYKVTVLTGIPNYPEGKFYEGYGYTHRRRERWNGADIIRIPLIPRGKTSIGLAANYLSFVVSGYLWVRMHPIHADKVFTYEVSPMTQGLVGVWYAKRHHVPHYIYVTDLWPENVEYLTGIHHKAVIAPLQKMADYIYHNSEKILTCSEGFLEPIKKRGVKESKIEFWPQYAEDFYRPVEKNAELGILQDGIFNMVFAGNVGQAQGLGILVDGARQLKEEGLKARFHIVGDGRYLAKLKEQIRDAQVSSYFHFISRKPAQEVAAYLALADAVLITLSKSNVFAITIPAKTQSCMACGRPILVSADGEIQRIVRDAGAGLCSDAEDSRALTENIKIMMNMEREEREAYGRRALQYSQRHFNKNMLLNRLDELLQGEKS